MRLSCNFVNVYMIAYRVYVCTRASLINSPNPNPDRLIEYPLSRGIIAEIVGAYNTGRTSESRTTVGRTNVATAAATGMRMMRLRRQRRTDGAGRSEMLMWLCARARVLRTGPTSAC